MEISIKISGPTGDRSQTITLGSVTIGRQDCDITLDDPDQIVSRLHARLFAQNGELLVRDESANGTWIGNSILPRDVPTPATEGSILAIGPYSITIESVEESEEDSLLTTEIPILERHQITAHLGRGGMATVHRARDRITGNTVALKLLHPEYVAQPGFIQRFRQEARLSSRVISPHASRVYEYYHDGPHHVLLMDFLEGETLAALLNKSDRLSESRTLVIAQDIAKALEAAGRVSVIHRDIKPSNVMLSPRGAVLMDFGIARAVSSSSISAEGDFVGTVHYCSPEQAAGREVDARSDLYSLGVLLFECLVGRPPFESDDPLEILWRKQEEAAEDIRILRPMISTATATLVALLLQTKPDDRPSSAIELSRLIAGAQRGDAPIASRRKPDPVAERNTDDLGAVPAGSGRVALYWIVGIALLITFIALYEACYLSGA